MHDQVTHFYSQRKNTDEMLRLLDVLLKQYADMETLYLSWDAASWHLSDRFEARVAEINLMRESRPEIPRIELAPLPSGRVSQRDRISVQWHGKEGNP